MKNRWLATLVVLTLGVLFQTTHAADHADGPRASADPAADITDVFAWTSPDATTLNLVMDVVRNATTASRFSDGVQYVFHTTGLPSFGARPVREVDITCVFSKEQKIRCGVRGEGEEDLGVEGDAGD